MELHTLLARSVADKASDLHLSAGLPPMLRVHGELHRIDGLPAVDATTVSAMLHDIMNDAQREQYRTQADIDFALAIDGLGRFRVNAFHQSRGAAAVFRTIAGAVPSLAQLGAPPIFAELARRPRGLVLVTGPTGSGKSTTLAAMIDHLNASTPGHILTVEDPIEFVHVPRRCLVQQREVGHTTHSFAAALRSALREDPDAILVGELRDLETIRLALTAAETGHLVFGTLHTASAAKTIDRIVDVFPGDEQALVRAMLSESLQAVIAQTLCRKRDGTGRVAAHEIMLGTPAIRNLIRENKVAQMYSAIQTSGAQGMQTLDHHLAALVRAGTLAPAEARAHARQPENFPDNPRDTLRT
ncbi:type IV pilus twitching motility protein PilT [Variovorax ginsengisoli]|uniref:Twitching motility protein PilT n=1 Tax=Variovorax ginsengisoli TaxID=363844 RepID=A0ABT9SA87_9BURK|nr:type IV pilus twitching motility protein PilT [Variovorax ginsengisoli]MDP9901275.1 twitching motility protein PilT [Variovorax ginsengisoli]